MRRTLMKPDAGQFETRTVFGRSDEIVHLDNDRNFPENGALTVQSLEAGR